MSKSRRTSQTARSSALLGGAGSAFCGLGAGSARGGIRDFLAADAGEEREFVKIAARGSHDVLDGVAADGERVGEKRTVAAPRHSFGAHDGAAFC